jgi:hypothetical protein
MHYPAHAIPHVDERCLCIVNARTPTLAAIVSSYLFRPDFYLPLFVFPEVTAPKSDGDSADQRVYLSNMMGSDTAVFVYNAWARMQNCEYVLLVGLDSNQKSYIPILPGTKSLVIDRPEQVSQVLSPMMLPEKPELRCTSLSFLHGLFLAQKQGNRLVIDEQAETLPRLERGGAGFVVVENVDYAASVVAVNYANSIGANLRIVAALTENEPDQIGHAIQAWEDYADPSQLEFVKDLAARRIGTSPLAASPFVTFFTEGLPYSLAIENAVPCTHVHLRLRPDLFVLNAIQSERLPTPHSAVLFSPSFFPDEETDWLRQLFLQNRYYVRALVGGDATVAALDYNVQHFSYGLLHLSSHGGEVPGWEVTEEFVDRAGNVHRIEYDRVDAYDPVPDERGMFRVATKKLPLKLDGLRWKSKELEARDLPDYVYDDLWVFLFPKGRSEINRNVQRKPKQRIPNSCAIRCSDQIHQGQFTGLAAHHSPVIFNNTCFSSSEVAKFFLFNGARAYIGTLWSIDNDAAVLGAKAFYSEVFSDTILGAFYRTVDAIHETLSRNVYMYWGLHFTTLKGGISVERSRHHVVKELLQSVEEWRRHIAKSHSEENTRNSKYALQRILDDLRNNFGVGK